MSTIKQAWFGTYYHGTTPKAEREILRKGLLARLGGSGATKAYSEAIQLSPLEEAMQPMADKFKKETAGRVSLSRSKLLSKIYGGILDPKTPGIFDDPKGFFQEAPGNIIKHQPLEVKNIGSTPLRRDPSHFFLGVQTPADIPPQNIAKSKPSGVIRKAIGRASGAAPVARELGGSALEALPYPKFRPEGGRDLMQTILKRVGASAGSEPLATAARAEAGPQVKRLGELIRSTKEPLSQASSSVLRGINRLRRLIGK